MLQKFEDKIVMCHRWFKFKLAISMTIAILMLLYYVSLSVYSYRNNAGLDAVQNLLEEDLAVNIEQVEDYKDTNAADKLVKISATVMWDYMELLNDSCYTEEDCTAIIDRMETEIKPLFDDESLYKTCLNRVYFALVRRTDSDMKNKVMIKYLLSYIYFDNEPFTHRLYINWMLSDDFDFLMTLLFVFAVYFLLSAVKELYNVHKYSELYYKLYSESLSMF